MKDKQASIEPGDGRPRLVIGPTPEAAERRADEDTKRAKIADAKKQGAKDSDKLDAILAGIELLLEREA